MRPLVLLLRPALELGGCLLEAHKGVEIIEVALGIKAVAFGDVARGDMVAESRLGGPTDGGMEVADCLSIKNVGAQDRRYEMVVDGRKEAARADEMADYRTSRNFLGCVRSVEALGKSTDWYAELARQALFPRDAHRKEWWSLNVQKDRGDIKVKARL